MPVMRDARSVDKNELLVGTERLPVRRVPTFVGSTEPLVRSNDTLVSLTGRPVDDERPLVARAEQRLPRAGISMGAKQQSYELHRRFVLSDGHFLPSVYARRSRL